MARLAAMWILGWLLCGGVALGAAPSYEDQPIGHGKGVVTANDSSHGGDGQPGWRAWTPAALALAGVVGLILLLRPLAKRLSLGHIGGATRAIEVLGSHVIGPRQRVLLLRVGKRLILVGHSGAGMNTLCDIHDPDEVASLLGQLAAQSSAVARPFSAAMKWARRRNQEATEAANEDVNQEVTRAEIEAATQAATRAVTQDMTPGLAGGEDASLATTHEEIGSLVDKVRRLSKQYQRT